MKKEKVRAVLAVEKERARKAREVVKVGPLAA